MNRVIVIVLIIFLIAAIGIGIKAINDDLGGTLDPRASNPECPPQELPENKVCAEGFDVELVKDQDGCYVFVCQ